MNVVRVLLHTTLVRNGSTRSPGQETVMEARMAGALAADGRVTILDGDNAIAARARDAVVEARKRVYGPNWTPGDARGVERYPAVRSDVHLVPSPSRRRF